MTIEKRADKTERPISRRELARWGCIGLLICAEIAAWIFWPHGELVARAALLLCVPPLLFWRNIQHLPTWSKRFLLGSAPFIILGVVWLLLVRVFDVGPVFLPPLEDMPRVLFRMFFPVRTGADIGQDHSSLTGFLFRRGSLFADVAISTGRIFGGFILSVIFATPLGILIGYSKVFRSIFSPIVGFVRYMPVPVFIPLCILWFGSGDLEKVMVIFVGGFFQLTLLVSDAAALVRSDYFEAATMLRAPRRDLVLRVLLPAAMPQIFDSYRVCLGWSWTYLLVAEILGATSGIGYYVTIAQRYVMVPQIFASMLIIGCFGMVTDLVLARLHKTFFPWVEKKTDAE